MFRVGIVGPHSTIERILANTQALKLEALFLSFPYEGIAETKQIIQKNKNDIDFWIFSGKISYQIALAEFQHEEHLIYIDHTEAGIFKGLIEFAYETKMLFDGFSIDEISESHLQNALQQIPIQHKKIFLQTFSAATSTEELVQFHLQHWKNGHTKGAITCYEEVYVQLKAEGVPVFRISTSDIEIRHTLEILEERIKTFYFKEAQIAVLLIEITQLENHFKSSTETYELQLLTLELKRILITLSEHLNGSLIEKGLGQYAIFSAHGDVEREMHKIEKAIQELTLRTGLKIGAGIGYGDSVLLAEFHAYQALKQSKENHTLMIMNEIGEVTKVQSPQSENDELPYFNNPSFIKLLESHSINVKHYIELFALVKRAGIKEFTVKDISTALKKDERNTRRFIENLSQAGLAEAIGYEAAPTRGRPRRMFKLTHSFQTKS